MQEVENLLCDEDLLKACCSAFYANEDKLIQAKELFFTKMKKTLDAQALEYATQTINERLKANLLDKPDNVEQLKSKMQELLESSISDIDSLVATRKTELQGILDTKDYAMGVKKYNYKGLIGIVPIVLEKEYKDKVFLFLDQHKEVLDFLRHKYFFDIPRL